MIGVYIARDERGAVLYVGSSGDIEKRLGEHSRTSSWWADVREIERIEVANRSLAYHREREFIVSLNPSCNDRSVGGVQSKSRAIGPVVRPRAETFADLIEAFGSVAKLAAAVGCDHMTMSDIWRGANVPSAKVIARLIVVTGIPFDDLFFVDPTEAPVEQWLGRRAPRTKGATA